MEYFQPSAQQQEMLARVRTLGEGWIPHTAKWDREDTSPLLDLLATARKANLVGLTVPKQYGGLDLNAIDYAPAVEQICRTTRS